MNTLDIAHFFPFSSQGNIYTLATLKLIDNTYKLLVASLKREVIYFEYNDNSSANLIPCAKEISFTYLPGNAEIVSITAFNKSEKTNDFVIGIAIVKSSNDAHALDSYLNIYAGWEDSTDFNIESISQNCLNNIELKFIPYQLTHTYMVIWMDQKTFTKECIFLLSGSDHKIHLFQESKSKHSYKEIDCKDFFPEFLKPPSIIMWLDVCYYNNHEDRLTVFGCECGYVRLCRVNTKTNKIIFNFSTRFNNTISSVYFYKSENRFEKPIFLKNKLNIGLINKSTIDLIVVNTVLPAVIFNDILHYGLKKYEVFPRQELTSVLSCVATADIDFDGEEEILIGNSRHEIMMYKFCKHYGWQLIQLKKFASPILGIRYLDMTGDGIKELVILTVNGVHILQHNLQYIKNILDKKYLQYN